LGCCTIEEKERTNVVDEGWLSEIFGNGRNGLMSISALAEMFDISRVYFIIYDILMCQILYKKDRQRSSLDSINKRVDRYEQCMEKEGDCVEKQY
jgi:hypothetical protein